MKFKTIVDSVARRITDKSDSMRAMIKEETNNTLQEIWNQCNWWFARRRLFLQTKAPYTTGTVTVTNGSTSVTGIGTDFTAIESIGQLDGWILFCANDDRSYRVKQYDNATGLTLAVPYEGTSGTKSFSLWKDIYRLDDRCTKILFAKTSERKLRHWAEDYYNELKPMVTQADEPLVYKPIGQTTEALYKTGLITVTNGSKTIQGVGISWLKIASGGYHSVAIASDGTLWAWGKNTSGQLGIGGNSQRFTPQKISDETEWADVACGVEFTIAIKNNGTLWGWGQNARGNLGTGNTTNQDKPVQIGTANNWTKISAGATFIVVLNSLGQLWSCGNNLYGQLGIGSTTASFTLTQIGSGTTWASISCGEYHAIATKTDGTLWAWGNNSYGQLGIGSTTDGTSPAQIGALTTWSKIGTGARHSFAIKTDGTLWAWGKNTAYQLGDGTTTQRTAPVQIGVATDWESVNGGHGHSMGIRTTGKLYGWGSNTVGQLGDGTTTSKTTPGQIGTDVDWNILAIGASVMGRSTMALNDTLILFTWGENNYGQLGDGTVTYSSTQIQFGDVAPVWTAGVVDRLFRVDGDDEEYIIDSFSSATVISSKVNYYGATKAAVNYQISPPGVEQIRLDPPPDAVYGLEYVGVIRPLKLFNDDDVPELPGQWHYILALGAYAKILPERETSQGMIDRAVQAYEYALKRLKGWHNVNEDEAPYFKENYNENEMPVDPNAWVFEE
ncbi:MAG: hypothetical protein V1709_08585 [Planctomycetota bacterium]